MTHDVVVVHVGAGNHCIDLLESNRKLVRRALDSQSIVECSECVERSILTNTGYGSNLNLEGNVECESSFIKHCADGRTQGSLLGITDQECPITCTIKVYDAIFAIYQEQWLRRGLSPPILLLYPLLAQSKLGLHDTGGGSNLVLPQAQAIFDTHKSSLLRDYANCATDTIGVLWKDVTGTHLVTSLGGHFFKVPGRVGCSGIVGAAIEHMIGPNVEICCMCSGNGEDIIKTRLAASVAIAFASHAAVQKEVNHAQFLVEAVRAHGKIYAPLASTCGFYVGVLVLLTYSDGRTFLVYCHSTESFIFGFRDRTDHKRVVVSQLEVPLEAGQRFACGEFLLG